jgi:hypothetical protein
VPLILRPPARGRRRQPGWLSGRKQKGDIPCCAKLRVGPTTRRPEDDAAPELRSRGSNGSSYRGSVPRETGGCSCSRQLALNAAAPAPPAPRARAARRRRRARAPPPPPPRRRRAAARPCDAAVAGPALGCKWLPWPAHGPQ